MSTADQIIFDNESETFRNKDTTRVVDLDVLHKYLPISFTRLFRNLFSATDDEPLSEANLSDFLKTKLFNYQLEDVRRAINQYAGRVLLAHEMGCGKTIISIAIAQHYGGKVLIICPSYLRANWRNELLKWTKHKIQIINKTTDDVADNNDALIISYDLLVRKIDDFKDYRFDTIVVDESQYLKNPKSKRFKHISAWLSSASKSLLLLSGTPATNCVRDLYAQLHILYPKFFDNYYEFTIRYCKGHQARFGWDDRGVSNVGELQFILSKMMIRRIKRDVLNDLPSKRRMKLYLEVALTRKMKTQNSQLNKIFAEMNKIQEIEDTPERLKKTLNKMLYLISSMFTELSHVKKKVLIEYFRENVFEDKFIIFAHHQHVLDALEELFKDCGTGYIRIDGSTKMEERQRLVDLFIDCEQKDIRVALLSLKACSTGLNFTPVSKMFFAEMLWEQATLLQAEDRINRIGCTSKCEYVYFICEKTIDERVFSNVTKKFKIIENLIDGGNNVDGFEFD
jgi:SWI/SNF-related matrix-associated actin-dependent regulator of chromatin subfamily A-like protein 1